jgi:lipopolysaccharide export system protein LptC
LCKIVNRLYKVSQDPEEWTARAYLAELEKYKALVEEYHQEGKKMNDEQDKLKNISIESKR